MDEDEQGGIKDKVNKGTAKQVGGEKKVDKKNLVKAFVNIVKAGFLHREADEADVEVYKNALTSDTTAGSEGEVGIGVTIPEDIRTDIIELRRSSDNLEQNRWDRINGLLMVGGEILAKMTPPYNLTGKDFEKVGITFASSGSGWQKGTKSSRFGRIVNSIGGSSSTYTCDYFWWNAGITAVALVGGSCNAGDYCGADCLFLYNSAGNADWNFGASVFLEQPIAA